MPTTPLATAWPLNLLPVALYKRHSYERLQDGRTIAQCNQQHVLRDMSGSVLPLHRAIKINPARLVVRSQEAASDPQNAVFASHHSQFLPFTCLNADPNASCTPATGCKVSQVQTDKHMKPQLTAAWGLNANCLHDKRSEHCSACLKKKLASRSIEWSLVRHSQASAENLEHLHCLVTTWASTVHALGLWSAQLLNTKHIYQPWHPRESRQRCKPLSKHPPRFASVSMAEWHSMLFVTNTKQANQAHNKEVLKCTTKCYTCVKGLSC